MHFDFVSLELVSKQLPTPLHLLCIVVVGQRLLLLVLMSLLHQAIRLFRLIFNSGVIFILRGAISDL